PPTYPLSLHDALPICLHRKTLLDSSAAGRAIDFVNSFQGFDRFLHTGYQKARLAILNDLAAGAEVHRDNRHAGGIGFSQDQSESDRKSTRLNSSHSQI